MKIKGYTIGFGCDWTDLSNNLINIELLSFHLERRYASNKIVEIWFTLLGFTLFIYETPAEKYESLALD